MWNTKTVIRELLIKKKNSTDVRRLTSSIWKSFCSSSTASSKLTVTFLPYPSVPIAPTTCLSWSNSPPANASILPNLFMTAMPPLPAPLLVN